MEDLLSLILQLFFECLASTRQYVYANDFIVSQIGTILEFIDQEGSQAFIR
jgi:hypothetical protein